MSDVIQHKDLKNAQHLHLHCICTSGMYPIPLGCAELMGRTPSTAGIFPEEIPEKFRKDPGNALRAFPGISLESTAGMPQTL